MLYPCPSWLSQLKAKFDLYYAKINHEHEQQDHNHDVDYAAIDHNHDERYYTKDEVDALLAANRPYIGEIRMWTAMPYPPGNGWFYCVGTEISRSEYSALFDLIGTTFGEGDGETTFNLPDFTARFPLGVDDIGPPYRPVGDIGGEAEHTLTTPEMPKHRHPGSEGQFLMFSSGSIRLYTQSGSYSFPAAEYTDYVGGDEPHNNMPPYVAVYFIIYAGP